MQNICLLCFERAGLSHDLCADCILELEPAFSGHANQVSLYQYNTAIRELILRAKMKNDFRAMECLKSLLLASKRINPLLSQIDLIVPSPSSAWGRMKGRFDLAWILAEFFSEKFSIPMQKPPFKSLWRWRKRSRLHNRKLTGLPMRTEGSPHILLIDDVLTTGYTLSSLADYYPNARISYLTVASAWRETVDILEYN